jgi:hypothetical protein
MNYRKPERIVSYEEFAALKARIEKLEAANCCDDEKDKLIAKAAELGVGAPSVLKRWSVDKLKTEIHDRSKNA